LQGLVDRLDSLLPLLSDGPRDAPERLQSLSRAIGWSYDLLSSSQRRMFRWCSVFNGGWTIDALITVCGRSPADGHEVVAELASLVDQNLVVVHPEPDASVRYLMLDSMREFAADQLRHAGEEHAARSAHASTFLHLAREARSMMLFGNCAEHHEAVQLLDRERLNVRAAFDWFAGMGMSEQALEAAASISPFNYLRGNLREDRDCLIAALSLPYDEATEARAFAIVRLSIAYWGTGDADSALRLAREGYELAKVLDCAWIEAIAISCQAENTAMRGEYDEALALGLQAITLFREVGPVYELCWALNGAGFAAGLIGNEPLSRELLAEGNELCRSAGHELFLGVSWCDQGILAYNRGDLAGAAQQFVLSASMLHGRGDTWYIARTVIGMAGVMLERGEIENAARMLGLGESLSLRVGNSPHAVTARQLDEITGRIQPLISQKRLASLLGEGREMPLSEAVRLIESFTRREYDRAGTSGENPGQHLQLTRREVQVLTLMASKSDKEIATDLKISRRTVTTHITHIFFKMGVKSRTEAVTVAMRRGLIPNRVA
jgi:DNA-binding CsgD family transcriptional regulator/tetratricopeptide (TPR) repeat protein